MELTVQNMYGLLLRSRLIPDDVAQGIFQTWKQEAGPEAQNVGQFAKWLIARQYLTEYQVELLAQGYAEGFFLGEYKILNRLGQGRLAGVYQAVHRSGQVVAIKVLPPSKSREPQVMARFQREARLAMKLNHPNVVRSFQVGEADGLHYLVMEHLDGEPLDEVLQKRGRFPPAEAGRIVYLALLGLQHIHEQRLVHRDLNPANLMLFPPPNQGDTTKCNVKILDIGLGREIFRDEASVKRDNGRITIAGAILGTPEYMSPEQARDARSADIRSDIYSLGCVLYRLIAGQPVFPDTNVISQMIRHASEEPRPLRELNPQVPEGLQQIVSTMLAKDPAKRFAAPDRAAEALRTCLQAGASPSERPEPSLEMRNYLTWLENEDKKSAKAAGGQTASLIAAIEAQHKAGATAENQAMTEARDAAKAAARANVRKMIESKRRRKRKLPKTRVQLPAPVAAPVNPAPATLVLPDVQLVPVAPAPAPSPFHITWRDFLMFTIGVIGSLAAIALAYLLAKLVT